MHTEVFVEGDTDAALVQTLCPELVVPRPQPGSTGREAAMRRAAVRAKAPTPIRIFLLLDRNGHSREEVQQEALAVCRREWKSPDLPPGPWLRPPAGKGAVRVVLSGLPDDDILRDLGCTRFMADDYLLRVLLDEESLRAFCEKENNLGHVPPSAAWLLATLTELAQSLRARGVRIDASKRFVFLVRAVLGFDASRATMMQHAIERCAAPTRERLLGALRNTLQEDAPLAGA